MKVSAFVAVVLASLLAAMPCPGRAQVPARMFRVGFLAPVSDGLPPFRQAMSEIGYMEGRNLEVVVRLADGRMERFPGLAQELTQSRLDAIVASSPPAIRAAKASTPTIPIVMGFSGIDPVKAGFVERLARPGGNVTGVALFAETVGKRLAMLKELLPQAKRIAVLAFDDPSTSGPQIEEAQRAAQALGVEILPVRVGGPSDYDGAFADAAARSQGILMLSSPLFMRDRQAIAEIAIRHRLPMICDWQEVAQAGCLMAYGPSMLDLMRRTAAFVHRILQGAKPAELAVERPDTFDLTINRETAAKLGIVVPEALRMQARTVP